MPPIAPTRLSGPSPSNQLTQDWKESLGDANRKIPLALSESLRKKDPEVYALLSSLSPDQLAALKSVDRDRSGSLSLKEVKAFLLKGNTVHQGGKFDTVAEALNALFTKAAGKTIDVRTPNASVLYLQMNNNTERGSYLFNGNGQAAERRGLSKLVAKDPDTPELTGLDITKEFNKGPTEARQAFRDGMQAYLDQLVKTGGSMTGLVLSGHSGGTDMLFQRPDHNYESRLDIRAELKRFRDMENPPGSGQFPYRAIFDRTEKVGLLACFQGGRVDEWRTIFPNAVVAGTQQYSPAASSPASPAIYGAACAARQYYEDRGDFAQAERAGRRAPNTHADGLQGKRDLQISVPSTPEVERLRAAARFELAKKAYAPVSAEIDQALKNGKVSSPERATQLYAIARTYAQAVASLNASGGNPLGPDGKTVDPAQADAVANRLFEMRFH